MTEDGLLENDPDELGIVRPFPSVSFCTEFLDAWHHPSARAATRPVLVSMNEKERLVLTQISIKDLEASSRGERELWIQALKAKRETGKLLEVPEDEVEEEVVEKKDKPPVPFKTAWGCTPTSALRKFFMKLAVCPTPYACNM
jgi:hypothetical protein